MTQDPILQRRAKIKRTSTAATRVGACLLGLALILFLAGRSMDRAHTLTPLISFCLLSGSIVLAPAIVIGYTVKAAEGADRDQSW